MQLKHNIWRKILKAAIVMTPQILIPSTSIFAQSCARKVEIESTIKNLQIEKKTVEKQCKDEKSKNKKEHEEKLKALKERCKLEETELKEKYKNLM